MTGFLARPGLALLMAVPVVVLLVWLDPAGLAGNRDAGGWSVLIYPVFFVYGFIFVASPALEAGIRRARWGYAALAGGLSLWVIVLWRGGGEPAFDAPGFARFAALYGINAWCWLLAIWGFGTLHLNRPASWLRYANDAVLPFYVLHQSVMLLVGLFRGAVAHRRCAQVHPDRPARLRSDAYPLSLLHSALRVHACPFRPPRPHPSCRGMTVWL